VTTAATGTTGAAVKAYIQTYYASNPGLLYVLLVGDHEQINSYNHGTAGSEIKWGDSFYGRLAGTDHYPEVMVGRFSSGSTQDINTMVTRTLEYEKTPLNGNWYTKGIGIGSNEGYGIGDDNEPDWLHMRNIGNKLVATGGYTYYHEFYDSTHGGNDAAGNPNASMVTNTVNSGASIFLYCGHGSQNTCVTSNFSTSNINASTNYGKYPFSIQVACNNGTFIGGTCFSEAFLRATGSGTLGPKGAIASVGSSILMAWAEPMQTEDEIGDILSNQYVNNKKYTLGGLFYNGQMSMLDDYPTNTGKEVMETWVMFGDPSCVFRSADPDVMTVTHDPCYLPGASTFSFTSSFGPNTYACVSQNNQVVGTAAVTSANTTITFTQPYNSSQSLDLTITGHNKKPFMSSILVCGPTGVSKGDKAVSISVETMMKDELVINYSELDSKNISVQIFDMTGRLIQSHVAETSTQGQARFTTAGLPSSVYLVSIKDENNKQLKTVKVVKQ
jgi:gingipain R